MTKKLELLAPGGDIESIKAAIVAGADAVYCGLQHFNARNRATNIEIGDLEIVLSLAHANHCKVFLTINILIIDNEFNSLINLLNKLVNTSLDGIIVQDLGLLYLLSKYFKTLEIHASTQLTTHNAGQIKFLQQLDTKRVNLCRELNLTEIEGLVAVGKQLDVSTEVFVHGSYCIGFSGICYLSSVLDGKSGNRGRCGQHCRDKYQTTARGKNFPLNLKDNSAFNDLHILHQAGVDSLKIEGRMKQFDYVYTVVNSWRKLLDQFYATGNSNSDDTDIYRVFNRTFTNGFLTGSINKEMFIDNPRDSSALQFTEILDKHGDSADLAEVKRDLHAARSVIKENVKAEIAALNVTKKPLQVNLEGCVGELLRVEVFAGEHNFNLCSKNRLATVTSVTAKPKTGKLQCNGLDKSRLYQYFEKLDEGTFFLQELNLSKLGQNLFLAQKEIELIGKKMMSRLVGAQQNITPVKLPSITAKRNENIKPKLSVLISSIEQIAACSETDATIYFQLPNNFHHNLSSFVATFTENNNLTPWFPAILIGENYAAAIKLLQQLQPKQIVTNNSGIAFEAYKMGIAWIAGPYLNSINSYTMLCLREKFRCAGAFVSNELSRTQIGMIAKPEGFELHYSIYHPMVLLTSRQCLLAQIEECGKQSMDDDCFDNCTRSTTSKNRKNTTLWINKSKGNYHSICHPHHFLNSDIVTDMPNLFSGIMIDLSLVENETTVTLEPAVLIDLFARLIVGKKGAKRELSFAVKGTNNEQYYVGI